MGASSSRSYPRAAEEGRGAAAETGTWAFLFSDIEGSTQLLLRLGDRYDEVLEQHREIVRAAIASHGGDEQGTEGDSFVIAFRDVTSAALAAIEAQRGLSQARFPMGVELKVRMGIHVGEARFDPGGGFNGLTLHTAARVMTTAHGGQIVVTRPCVEILSPGAATPRSLGSYQLRDLPTAIELFQLEAPGLAKDFPALRAASLLRTGDRPRVRTPLRGRARELQHLTARLSEPGAISLIGPPGTGKTRLAVEALECIDLSADRALFVDLAVVSDAERTAARVADVLGIQSDDDTTEAIAEALSGGPCVLTLDNCEHVIRGVTPLVELLLNRCPRLTVLCTSREALGVDNEAVIPLPPLDTTNVEGGNDAVLLFLDRARAQGVDVAEAELPEVLEVVQRLDGIPLAIELAAGLASTLSPREIAERLSSRFRVLGRRGGGATDRHQTMLAAVRWGYELLSPGEQGALRALCVCAGAFDLRTAEALLAEADSAEAIDLLHRLIRTSWLTRESTAYGSRYRFLETFKEFGEQEADRQGDLEVHRRRHAEHFLARAMELADRTAGAEQVAAHSELDAHFEDIWLAVTWSTEDPDLLARAVEAFVDLTRYWQTRPDWSETEELLNRVAAAVDSGLAEVEPAEHSKLRAMVGFYRFMGGDLDEALKALEWARVLAVESQDPTAQARAARVSGMVMARTDELYRALSLTNECVQIAEQHDLASFLNMAYQDRAGILASVEGLAPAIEDARAAGRAAAALADAQGVLFAHWMLMHLHMYAGNNQDALDEWAAANAALEICRHQVAAVFLPVDRALLTQDSLRVATREAVEGARRLGRKASRVDAHALAAVAALAEGDVADARTQISQALELGGAGQGGTHEVVMARAAVALTSGDTNTSRGLLLRHLGSAVGARARGSWGDTLWLLSSWSLLPAELCGRAADAVRSLVPIFGMSWQVEVFTGAPRPFDSAATPRPMSELDEIVKEILEAATGIEPVYGALQAPA